MKKTSLLMIISAVLVVVGIATCFAGAVSGASELLVITDRGLQITDEALQNDIVSLLNSVNIDSPFAEHEKDYIVQKTELNRSFNQIFVDVNNANVEFHFQYDNKFICEYGYHKDKPIAVKDNGAILSIGQEGDGTIDFNTSSDEVYVKIYIPKTYYIASLSCYTVSGDITVFSNEFDAIEDLCLASYGGDIKIRYTKAQNVSIKNAAGDIAFEIFADKLSIENDVGKIFSERYTANTAFFKNKSGETALKGHVNDMIVIDSVSGHIDLVVEDHPENVSLEFKTTSGTCKTEESFEVMKGDCKIIVHTDLSNLNLAFEHGYIS